MKITSINIVGLHKVINTTYNFNDFNYISGPNGAGKSTIIDAIEYALFGYIPGTRKNSNEDLFKHANSDNMSVTLNILDLQSGCSIVIRRSLAKVGNKIVSGFSIDPDTYTIDDIISDLELPVFNFNEFINMSSNKLKDWFIEFLPSADYSVDWSSQLVSNAGVANILDDALVPDVLSAIKSFDLSGVEEIRKTNEYIKSLLSFKNQEMKRLQSTTQSLVYYDDFQPSESTDTIKEEISKFQNYKTLRMSYSSVLKHNAEVESKLSQLSPENNLEELRKEIDTERAVFNKLSEELIELNSVTSAIEGEIATKTRIINSNGLCPYTSTSCSDIQKLISQYRNEVIQSTATVVDHRNKISALKEKLNTSTSKINVKESQFNRAIRNASEYEALKGSIKPVPDVSDIPEIDEIELKLTSLHDALVKTEANKKYQELVDSLTSEKNKVEQDIEILKNWDKLTGTNGLQAIAGRDAFLNIAEEIHRYLPDAFHTGTRVKFISEGKANSFSFGLCKDDVYIPFDILSSGEKCIVTLALLLAIVKQAKSELKLIIVDDLFDHLDDNNIEMLFDMLETTTGVQMVFAGVKTLAKNYTSLNSIQIS